MPTNSKTSKEQDFLPPPQRPKWLFVLRLFLFAGLVLVLLGVGRYILSDDKESILTFFGEQAARLGSNIVNLEIVGKDNEARLYVLTAVSAKPKEGSGRAAIFLKEGSLNDLEITMEWQKDKWFSLRAATGKFNYEDKRLLVGPNFNVYFSNGYQFKGLEGSINLNTSAMIMQGQVEGWGLGGQISAAALEVAQGGEYMRFYGGVEMLLLPEGQ